MIPIDSKCKCSGVLSLIGIMTSDPIPIDDVIKMNLETEEGCVHLNGMLDTVSTYTTLELRCSKCFDPKPADDILIDYLSEHGFVINT